MSVTYTDIVNKARSLRRLILKLTSYDLARQLLESINVTTPLDGKLFESPTSLRYNSGLTNHVTAPIPEFVIKDASGNVYTDIGVESPLGAPISVETDSLFEEYVKRRLAYTVRKKKIYAHVRVGSKHATFTVGYFERYVVTLGIVSDYVVSFNYPADQPPKLGGDNTYTIFIVGTAYDLTEKVEGDDINVNVSVVVADFLAYVNENDQYVGGDGIYVFIDNYESDTAEIDVPNICSVTVSGNRGLDYVVSTNWNMIVEFPLS